MKYPRSECSPRIFYYRLGVLSLENIVGEAHGFYSET